jgi:hypothetical protein
MADFDPRLVGPVLTGTASAHSDIQLHLFSESAEAVLIRLEERGVPHEALERRLRFERDRAVMAAVCRVSAASRAPAAVFVWESGPRKRRSNSARLEASSRDDGGLPKPSAGPSCCIVGRAAAVSVDAGRTPVSSAAQDAVHTDTATTAARVMERAYATGC